MTIETRRALDSLCELVPLLIYVVVGDEALFAIFNFHCRLQAVCVYVVLLRAKAGCGLSRENSAYCRNWGEETTRADPL